jgi:signal transduction histidine kinase
LQQVFWNLIQNAIKFTPEGGSITMKSYSQGRQICVEVADTGCGIDSPDLEKIFEPFEQGPGKSKESLHGLGLGLAIARRLVEAHDGTLTASSQGRNCGAVFTVTLGLAPAKSALKKTRLSRKLQGR